MALKLKLEPTFWWPTNITIPGEQKPAVVEFEFAYMTRDEFTAWNTRILDAARTGAPLKDEDLVLEIASNWRGVDGEFNRENVVAFLNAYPSAGNDISFGYQEALVGSRRGNSKR